MPRGLARPGRRSGEAAEANVELPAGAPAPASLADAPGLLEGDADVSFSEGAAIDDLLADYDHASLRVVVHATRADATVADAAPPGAANETAPNARALHSRSTTVKGLVQEPTDGGEAAALGSRGAESEPS